MSKEEMSILKIEELLKDETLEKTTTKTTKSSTK